LAPAEDIISHSLPYRQSNFTRTPANATPPLFFTNDVFLLPQNCEKAIHPGTRKLAEYRELRQYFAGAEWEQAAAEEIGPSCARNSTENPHPN
jgi:hypothetical protein